MKQNLLQLKIPFNIYKTVSNETTLVSEIPNIINEENVIIALGQGYWKQLLYDVLAMVKQLGIPTYFLTLSCADLR